MPVFSIFSLTFLISSGRLECSEVFGDVINVDFSSSTAPSRVILSLESGNLTGMDLEWTHGIVLRQNDFGDALLLYLEGTVTSAKLSTVFGEPDIINLDLGNWSPITKWIYLDLDRGANETAQIIRLWKTCRKMKNMAKK